MPKPTRTKEQMKFYMRDRRAKLLEAKAVLSKSVHMGISVTSEIHDGQQVLRIAAKFNQEQLDALEELAAWEGTDAEVMVEDFLLQAGLEWRRQSDARRAAKK